MDVWLENVQKTLSVILLMQIWIEVFISFIGIQSSLSSVTAKSNVVLFL